MKSTLTKLLLVSLSLFSSAVFASGPACQTTDAKVKQVFSWPDGTSFVELNKQNNCACPITNRFGILAADPNAKTLMAQALTALANNHTVTVMGAAGCAAHSNSAALYTLVIQSND